MNPYTPPTPLSGSEENTIEHGIPDSMVHELIAAVSTETIALYDVSDEQIYGMKRPRRLQGDLAQAAIAAGCDPIVFQTVLWRCLVFVPVYPKGTYVVLPCLECDDPHGDADQYRAIRIATDSSQIAFHYAIVSVLLIPVLIVLWWICF